LQRTFQRQLLSLSEGSPFILRPGKQSAARFGEKAYFINASSTAYCASSIVLWTHIHETMARPPYFSIALYEAALPLLDPVSRPSLVRGSQSGMKSAVVSHRPLFSSHPPTEVRRSVYSKQIALQGDGRGIVGWLHQSGRESLAHGRLS
jgi:hypothetical protein